MLKKIYKYFRQIAFFKFFFLYAVRKENFLNNFSPRNIKKNHCYHHYYHNFNHDYYNQLNDSFYYHQFPYNCSYHKLKQGLFLINPKYSNIFLIPLNISKKSFRKTESSICVCSACRHSGNFILSIVTQYFSQG